MDSATRPWINATVAYIASSAMAPNESAVIPDSDANMNLSSWQDYMNHSEEEPSTVYTNELGNYMYTFRDHYTVIHGYLSIVVCVFGMITNVSSDVS